MQSSPGSPRPVWQGRFLRVLQNGAWEYVERTRASAGVVIVAVTDCNELILVEQFRVPLQNRVIELPAGLAGDTPGSETEALAVAARRELMEETGFEAREMIHLTAGPTSAGLTNELNVFFRATGLRRVGTGGGDPHEAIDVHLVPLAGIDEWLRAKAEAGLMIDPKVFAGLYFISRS